MKSNLVNLALMGLRIVVDPYMSDSALVKLTWRERLFSLPWRPWTKYKTVHFSKAYFLSDGSIAVSPETMGKLESALLDEKTEVTWC